MTTSPNRLLATVFGAVYLFIGLIGFAFTGGVDFFATSGGKIFGIFEVNVFHNVAHLLIGAALVIAGLSTVRAAKAVNTTIGAAYLLLGVAGLFLVGSAANILAINAADNVLHFASAAVLLAVGLGADKNVRAAA
ncbi:MAG: hypothetical protein RI885_305 [Actinomycetota bacterium]|jgi:hypothetical protein